jgi:alkanesulfonate monooxygenase SsuD/methylene tetrahydromethanopterin reductase-like flavin-dependent oxidoreductase (luciferase family)
LGGDDWASIAIVSGGQADLNIVAASPQDEHDDDDEKDEANKASADVDTGCEQHVARATQTGDTANGELAWPASAV